MHSSSCVCSHRQAARQQWPDAVHSRHHRRPPARCPGSRSGGSSNTDVEPTCLVALASELNPQIAVWQIPKDVQNVPPHIRDSVVLMLDPSGNIHSIVRQHAKTHLTGAYWDALAVLPALVPDGPVSILGLAGGTIAWLLQELYPGRQMHGWELDPAVVEVAQQHMGLQRLQDSGRLVVHVGDALAPSAAVPGGFAGTIVDLFAEGELIHELLEASAWAGIRQRLAPGGRVIVNLGPAPMQGMPPAQVARTLTAMAALAEAFDGHLVCCSFSLNDTANMLAISGPPPTAEDWARVPAVLKQFATGGRFVGWETFAAFKESKASSFFNW